MGLDIKGLLFKEQGVKHSAGGVYAKGSVQEFLPVSDIKDGVIITKDGRYVKVLEVLPVNFYLKSEMEQRNIVYYFSSYLKIAPDSLQISVITQKADIGAYMERMWSFYDDEENGDCREMIQDNINTVYYLAHNEAVTRRFFLVFQLEPQMKLRGNEFRDISARLNEEAETARKYLDFCGLEVINIEGSELIKLFYGILNKKAVKNGFSENIESMFGENEYNEYSEGENQDG
jgi:hypothetical protein